MALRPARWMSCAALRMMPAQAAFSILPTSRRLLFFSLSFQSAPKIPYCRRAEQGRFNHIAPAKAA